MVPGNDNFRMLLGEYAGPVRLCMIDSTKQASWECMSVSLFLHFSDKLSPVLVRAEPHNGYVTERLGSSGAQCQDLVMNMVMVYV